jgi:uncharacterized membrane protein
MDIRRLVRIALLAALVAVATLVLRIPMPATEGYINVGDAVIVAGALLLVGRSAGLAGGIGSALADGLGGYAHWAPFTLFLKGEKGWLSAGFTSGLSPICPSQWESCLRVYWHRWACFG